MYQVIDDWRGWEKYPHFLNSLNQLDTDLPYNLVCAGGAYDDGSPFYSHMIMKRVDDSDRLLDIRSKLIFPVVGIINDVCYEYGIPFSEIFRANINHTVPMANKTVVTDPHTDHEYPHKNFIIYLNDCDGDTLLYDSKIDGTLAPIVGTFTDQPMKQIARITPKAGRILIFDGQTYHTGEVPKTGIRKILVTTFG